MIRLITVILPVLALAVPAVAAPPSSSSSGKVSMQDMHFTTKADAAAHCDKAPVTMAADGSFVCSMPTSSDMAINEKGLPGTKTKPASKPQ